MHREHNNNVAAKVREDQKAEWTRKIDGRGKKEKREKKSNWNIIEKKNVSCENEHKWSVDSDTTTRELLRKTRTRRLYTKCVC